MSCIAALGTGGCGFEHQIASVWKALGGDVGGVPMQNQGFLRDDALLAIVLITDEDDCSAPADTDLFDPSQTLVTDPLGPIDSYRCNEFGHLCDGVPPPRTMAAMNLQNCTSNENGKLMRVADFVTFFKGLKASPDDVIVAAITGPPTPYSVTLQRVRERTTGTVEMEPRIVPSCTSSNGEAAPSVRIQQFVEAFGDNGTFESICDGDFSPAMARIGDKIAGRIRHQCLEQPPVDRDPARPGVQANCEVYQETKTSDGPVRTSINSCDDASPPCWRIQSDSTCPGTGTEVIVDRGSVPAPPRTSHHGAVRDLRDRRGSAMLRRLSRRGWFSQRSCGDRGAGSVGRGLLGEPRGPGRHARRDAWTCRSTTRRRSSTPARIWRAGRATAWPRS